MQLYQYENNELFMAGFSLKELAQEYGTPLYVYSADKIRANFAKFKVALDSYSLNANIYYAVKANSNLSIIKLLSDLGSGFDIVSIGELKRIIAAGASTQKVVFSGVGKTNEELKFALEKNIKCINVESFGELERLAQICQNLGIKANIGLRLNPNIDAKTHPYISTGLKENKFGIDIDFLHPLVQKLRELPNLNLVGLAFHLGSQITEKSPFLDALTIFEKTLDFFKAEGFSIKHLDLGGGYSIKYKDEDYFNFADLLSSFAPSLEKKVEEFLFAPGRAIVGDAGALLAKVEYLKKTETKNFAILDTSMNDLIRPALYSAWHKISEVSLDKNLKSQKYDLVGSVCETGDFLAKSRVLYLAAGNFVAIKASGAYGFSMASNYNSRLLPAEVLLDGEKAKLIRRRQNFNDLYSLEQGL